jgi:hypothetical protein
MLKTSKAAARTTLKVEGLEDRTVPAVVFYTNAGGTEAYNTVTGAFRHLENTRAVKMTEGADGVLVASYATGARAGTWVYNYHWNEWAKISNRVATALDAPTTGGTVFVSLPGGYDGGVYKTGGTFSWSALGGFKQLSTATATQIAAVDHDTFFAVTSAGTSRYDQGRWLKLTGARTGVVAASGDGTLMASYGDGTWIWNGAWRKISVAPARTIGGKVGTRVIAGFDNGVYSIDVNTYRYTQMDARRVSVVALGQSGTLSGDLFASFANNQGGLTMYRPGSWGTWLSVAGAAEQIAR